MSEVDEFLGASSFDSHPSFKFHDIGATITGTITGQPRVVETDDLSGERTKKLLVDLTVADGTVYTLWINGGRMAGAVADAVKETGGGKLTEGGQLSLKHTGVAPPSKPGFNGAKLYAAKYVPPAPSVAVDDVFAGEEPF